MTQSHRWGTTWSGARSPPAVACTLTTCRLSPHVYRDVYTCLQGCSSFVPTRWCGTNRKKKWINHFFVSFPAVYLPLSLSSHISFDCSKKKYDRSSVSIKEWQMTVYLCGYPFTWQCIDDLSCSQSGGHCVSVGSLPTRLHHPSLQVIACTIKPTVRSLLNSSSTHFVDVCRGVICLLMLTFLVCLSVGSFVVRRIELAFTPETTLLLLLFITAIAS